MRSAVREVFRPCGQDICPLWGVVLTRRVRSTVPKHREYNAADFANGGIDESLCAPDPNIDWSDEERQTLGRAAVCGIYTAWGYRCEADFYDESTQQIVELDGPA